MHISHIKLSGFKSFVDPTTLKLPRTLTCIVGPNGCGKSNIIDAINWVLGESSAKHLRGESMADVIFNGAASRKPVGQASVEIVFDNSDGTIAGQYAGYNEISIRRQVNRDGTSAYFLNGARARKKDVTNVFLGTGLGSRGYSIIEQGMISRVVEARPEDLRAFLEEAAGISKYKERRRETEHRIRHTVDNLDRVSDILGELESQLNRLKRQAQSAEKYQVLAADQKRLEAELAAITWRDFSQTYAALAARVAERETALTQAQTELGEAQAAVSDLSDTRERAANRLAEAQRHFYEISNRIDSAEQALKFRRERAQALRADADRLETEHAELASLGTRDQELLEGIQETLATRRPALEAARGAHQTRLAERDAAEQALNAWQAGWDDLNLKRSEALRARELAAARLEQCEASQQKLADQRTRLEAEAEALDMVALEQAALRAREALEVLESQREQETATRQQQQDALRAAREAQHSANGAVDAAQSALHGTELELASLNALQDADLGIDSEAWVRSLRTLGLADAPRVFASLQIDAGYERAVSVAARLRVDAFMLREQPASTLLVADPEQTVEVLFAADTARAPETATPPAEGLKPLAASVRGAGVGALLAGCWLADSREAALAAATVVDPRELVVTRDGAVFGRGWMRLPGAQGGSQVNVLARASEIEAREVELGEAETRFDRARQTLAAAREEVQTIEQAMVRSNQTLDALTSQIREAGRVANASQAEFDRSSARAQQIEETLSRNKDEAATLTERADEARTSERDAAQTLAEADTQLERERARRQAHAEALEAARQAVGEGRETMHSLELEIERLETQIKALQQSIVGYATRDAALQTRKDTLGRETAENESPIPELEQTLQEAIGQRQRAEDDLNAARHALAGVDEQVRQSDQARTALQNRINAASEALTEVQLEQRAVSVRVQDIADKLAAMQAEPSAILATLAEDADPAAWEEELAAVMRRITRLGPINMAAIEEYAQLDERKSYLDRQHTDLTEALDTLREAIGTIDRETRTRFRETFDRVNDTMKTLFPRLFGGGHAYLELTSEDLLEAGVAVMARPPGKRNATIHLLSGGEKALTAIAFVFSIFELNPAPFCLLDEVDAPLDDSNVVRLTRMLEEMAARVQFAVITHNKITMEIGQQLIGVTMNEPGVSRLVSVSMDEAVDLAQSA